MKKVASIGLILFTGWVLFRCADDNELEIDQLSEEARTFLAMRLNRSAQFEATAAGLINRSFGTMSGGRFSGGRTQDDPQEDSTLVDDPWSWNTCAEVTETENEDASVTVIRDYGEGCEEGWEGFKYWMFGKLTETYRYLNTISGTKYQSNYFSNILYEGYGGRYSDDFTWLIDGTTHYNGWCEWDTVTYQFSGSFSENSNLTSRYCDWEYSYSSEGTSVFDDHRWEQAAGGFYRYAEGDNFYRSDILKKLVMRFDCTNDDRLGLLIWGMTYVSGLEKISYRQNGKTGEFMIDYGNGDCDNVIHIIENGKRIRIKMDSLWTIFHGG